MSTDLSKNYFELFGLPVSFELDGAALSEKYRELQKTVHPDKFANASDRDRRLAVQQAARINEAFHTLKSPLKRARYILELRGVVFDDQHATSFEPDFLMEQMELRETLGGIRQQPDAMSSLGVLMQQVESKIRDMTGQLTSLIAQDDLDQARSQIHKLQFMEKLLSECEAMEEELVDLV
jgi:molecular chaperone HscB